MSIKIDERGEYYPIPSPKDGYDCIWVSRPDKTGEWYGRPVKAEPKYSIRLYSDQEIPQIIVNLISPISKDQAQLIKDCCDKMIKSLFSEQIEGPDLDTVIAMNKARHSIKGDR